MSAKESRSGNADLPCPASALHAKFTGDFGNAIEVIRITERSPLSVFAKNLEPCNFRLLQHSRGESGLRAAGMPGLTEAGENCRMLPRSNRYWDR